MTTSMLAPAATGSAAESRSDQPTLRAEGLELRYDRDPVIEGLSVTIPPGRVTTIVGPNACGKSTLLRALARLLAPAAGRVLLGEGDIARQRTREVARRLTLLPQSPIAPDGITVAELVSRGRYPYQSLFRAWSSEDGLAVAAAMEATGVTEVAERPVNQLSGGQRQRVWVAMALAQDTPLLLLDEPTTYLDLSHQIEVLDLLRELNRETGRTIVLVLHDLNLASRYSDHLIAMAEGCIEAEGTPGEVITEATVRRVFGLETTVVADPVSGTPLVVPIGRHGAASRARRDVNEGLASGRAAERGND
jgi:iron complex transport system ATP-binding protein